MDALFFVLMAVLLWFMLIRPQRRRAVAAATLQRSLEVGQRVMTSSGLFGTIVELSDQEVTLEVAPGTHTTWVRAAIASVATTPEPKE